MGAKPWVLCSLAAAGADTAHIPGDRLWEAACPAHLSNKTVCTWALKLNTGWAAGSVFSSLTTRPKAQNCTWCLIQMCVSWAVVAGYKKRLAHLRKSGFSLPPELQDTIPFPTTMWKNEEKWCKTPPPQQALPSRGTRANLMSNLCSGDISSPITRSKRAWASLIKHPDCLVLPYYHLNLPTASRVRPEAHNPDSDLTSLSWLIDPDFGATGRRTRAWSSAELGAKYRS